MTLVRLLLCAVVALTLLAPASSQAATADGNPWLERRVLNIAHQGGEIEAPSNTLFAFKTAKDKGSDVLELDVHATRDGELVVIHDTTVNRTTNGAGRIDQMTLEQLKTLDAAHWFVPDCGTCHGKPDDAYAYRGYATGEHEIPDDWGEERRDLGELGGATGTDVAGRPIAFVMFERGDVEQRVVHNEERVTAREAEREREALARKYAEYAQGTDNPITFDQYVEVMRQLAR